MVSGSAFWRPFMTASLFHAKAFRRGALALTAATLLSALPLSSAEAQYYPHRRHRGGEALAGGVIGGVLGGLAAGAIIGSSRPAYAAPVYEEPAPVYVRPRPFYRSHYPSHAYPDVEFVPVCRMERQRVWLDQYTYTDRYVRACH
jgi:hypothetical protein